MCSNTCEAIEKSMLLSLKGIFLASERMVILSVIRERLFLCSAPEIRSTNMSALGYGYPPEPISKTTSLRFTGREIFLSAHLIRF